VETEAELTAVWETGIQLVQGWHLGRPTALGCGAGRDAPDWIESGVPVDDIL
jgi:EAL domain-containing protein (putative c-di-GMP-specific phosphodiesterase class I)